MRAEHGGSPKPRADPAPSLANSVTADRLVVNVGNLVCPASYDLGEDLRVVLLSVAEGEDKPVKYPTIFKRADAVIVTKTDLAAATCFDRAAALASIAHVSPKVQIFEVSARNGAGLPEWYAYLERLLAEERS